MTGQAAQPCGGPGNRMQSEDELSRTFEALAASTRRAILARLARGPATFRELAEKAV